MNGVGSVKSGEVPVSGQPMLPCPSGQVGTVGDFVEHVSLNATGYQFPVVQGPGDLTSRRRHIDAN